MLQQRKCLLQWTILVTQISTALCSPGISFSPRSAALLQTREDRISCAKTDPKLPAAFSCPSADSCISLDNSSSALCCPANSNCNIIRIIPCDVSKQDVSKNPGSQIFTSRLKDNLPTCGSSCCPFGYTCLTPDGGDPVCQLDISKSLVKANNTGTTTPTDTAVPLTSPTATSVTSSAAPAVTTTNNASVIDSTTPHDPPKCSKFPAGVFIAGFLPGIIVGILGTLAWVIFSGRHYPPNGTNSDSPIRKNGLVISDPIPIGANGLRTDFLRRTTTRARSMFSTRPTPKLNEGHWKTPTPPVPNNVPSEKIVTGTPITPERRLPHPNSMESIRVYSPPSLAQPAAIAQVAPLRGMVSQRTPSGSYINAPPTTSPMQSQPQTQPQMTTQMGSPFKTPPNRSENPFQQNPSPDAFETLSPTRYGDGAALTGGSSWSRTTDGQGLTVPGAGGMDKSRPNTTFTDMLNGINFPDPMRQQNSGMVPAVPKIPNQYGGGRR